MIDQAREFADWLRQSALPLWLEHGRDEAGRFVEALDEGARPVVAPRRMRVQPRQVHVYATAARLGWAAGLTALAPALEGLDSDFRRPDGAYRTLLTARGAPADETAMIYDHAFLLLSLAGFGRETEALAVRDQLLAARHPAGGLREGGARPFQANSLMHLLEACQAWEAISADAGWRDLADEIVALALRSLIVDGVLFEFFEADWSRSPGPADRRVEPGHQFEWATLLARHAAARGQAAPLEASRALYAAGLEGVVGGFAVDCMEADGSEPADRARLWPQTEWLKASLALLDTASDRRPLLAQAEAALAAVDAYLTPHGLWRDKRLASGEFVREASPASSFYHLMAAFEQLAASAAAGRIPGLSGLDLR